MRPEIDLSLLRDNLVELNETSYFSSRLNEFNAKLVEAIDHVLSNAATYGARTVYAFAVHVHHAERYLAGSTIKDAPYELEYCLKTALPRWVTRENSHHNRVDVCSRLSLQTCGPLGIHKDRDFGV